jgi:hypothetical protein
MNDSRKTIALLLLLIVSAVFSWFVMVPGFPFDRTITNSQGKSMDVTIQGKDSRSIYADRRADGERFTIPIRSLSLKDRLITMVLPNQPAPPKGVPIRKEEGFVETRLKLIAELTVKLELYEKEVSSQTLNDLLARKREEDVLKIKNEIKALQVAIDGYKYRTRSK